jgi:hypothetical protein
MSYHWERSMAAVHRWSVTLACSGPGTEHRHPRWLDEDGRFSADPSRALRLASPEIAVQRIQAFLALHGNKGDRIERFRLVPAPPQQLWKAERHPSECLMREQAA